MATSGARTRSIRGRLQWGIGILGILLVVMALLTAAFAADSVRQEQRIVAASNRVAFLVFNVLERAIDGEAVDVGRMIERDDPNAEGSFEDNQDHVIEALTSLDLMHDAELTVLVARVRDAHDAWADEWLRPARNRLNAGQALEGARLLEGRTLLANLRASLQPLDAYVTTIQAQVMASQQAAGDRGVLMVLGLLGALVAGLGAVGLTILRSVGRPLEQLIVEVRRARETGHAEFDVSRKDEIGELAETLQGLHEDLADRYAAIEMQARRAELFSRLGERLTTTIEEQELMEAAAIAIRQLLPYVDGSISLLSASANRLTVATAWGDDAPSSGEHLRGDPRGCPAVRRSAPHVVRDEGEALAERCRILPRPTGHQGCIPMLAMGKVVGVLHLSCPSTTVLDPAGPSLAQRVAEQLGLAIANTRLTRTLERLAMTDPLTGLGNARNFDAALLEKLNEAQLTGRDVGVIFLDLDHFKTFNDTHGHPAGDEALRTLGLTLTSSVRDDDLVARYGGEEFVIAVANADLAACLAVGEKIRLAIEQMVVTLGPGRFARVTASLGVAATDSHGFDAAGLIRTADAALYSAKRSGRNRVAAAGAASEGAPAAPITAAIVERRHARARRPEARRLVS